MENMLQGGGACREIFRCIYRQGDHSLLIGMSLFLVTSALATTHLNGIYGLPDL
jgi:hypothetical protein